MDYQVLSKERELTMDGKTLKIKPEPILHDLQKDFSKSLVVTLNSTSELKTAAIGLSGAMRLMGYESKMQTLDVVRELIVAANEKKLPQIKACVYMATDVLAMGEVHYDMLQENHLEARATPHAIKIAGNQFNFNTIAL
jgi:hypothetical protein